MTVREVLDHLTPEADHVLGALYVLDATGVSEPLLTLATGLGYSFDGAVRELLERGAVHRGDHRLLLAPHLRALRLDDADQVRTQVAVRLTAPLVDRYATPHVTASDLETLAHLTALVSAIVPGTPESATAAIVELVDKAVALLVVAGTFTPNATLTQDLVARLTATRGLAHPQTLIARVMLAQSALYDHRGADAIPFVQALERDCEVVLGTSDQSYLTARATEASLYAQAGDLRAATAITRALVADCDTIYGPESRQSTVARSNLATYLIGLGRRPEAQHLLEEVLALRTRHLAPDHPSTLLTRGQLIALSEHVLPAHQLAPQREQLLRDYERVFGPNHHLSLAALFDLAATYSKAGRHTEAVAAQAHLVTRREHLDGPDGRRTLRARGHLGVYLRRAGLPRDAAQVFERTVADCARVLGPDDSATQSYRQLLAATYRELGRPADARRVDLPRRWF